MENKTINLYANNQTLVIDKIIEIVSDTENYIYANVDLGENWEFDSVRAIWSHGIDVPMVISNGRCKVPADVIADVGVVKVNLVGSNVENGVLVDRLTTEQIPTILVKQNVPIDGTDPQEITPSQFEQFVEAVKEDADRAEQGAQNASASATSASESAESAHDDKIEIEQAIAEVIQQIEDFEQVEVVVNTLPAGSQATSDFTDGVLTLGIPQGAKGDTGNGISSCVLNPDYTLTINFTDGTSYTTASIRGVQGAKGDTGNGISSITKTGSKTVDGRVVDTYTTAFTDGETTEFEVTNGKDGEVTMSQLSSLLPTDTASGSIASFPDGTDLFSALSVKAQIEQIQDLHGYDKPWSGGSGANKWDEEWEQGIISWTGINSDDGSTRIRSKNYIPCVAGNEYRVVTSANLQFFYYDSNKAFVSYEASSKGNGSTITIPTGVAYFRFYTYPTSYGATYNNDIAINYPSSVTTYSPYSNICPISGHTECVTSVSGVNVWDEEWELGYINSATGGNSSSTTDFRSKNYIRVIPNALYYVYKGSDYGTCRCAFYDKDKVYLDSTDRWKSFGGDLVIPNNAYYMRFYASKATYNHDISINYPSTDHEYHAYNGHTYTTALGRTVYGGTLDVVSGELVVDRAMVDLGTLNWVYNSSQSVFYTLDDTAERAKLAETVCNIYAYSSVSVGSSRADFTINAGHAYFGTSRISVKDTRYTDVSSFASMLQSNSAKLCYQLVTPHTYQLDPTEVDLLLGQNNVWTDCGSVEVTYKADIERWVNKKINALI